MIDEPSSQIGAGTAWSPLDVGHVGRPTTVVVVARPDDPVSHRLADQMWPTVADGAAPVLIVPLGACEQHGPHLPIGTDTRIAAELAERLAAALAADGRRAWVAPAITITASGEHQGFAGTLSIGTEAMRQVVVELVRSATWAAAVILVNGHGGNRDAVDAAEELLVADGHRVLSWWPSLPADLPAGDLHAGFAETSMMLALAPDRVDPVRAEAGPDRVTLDELRDRGVAGVSPNGVLGDPAGASAGAGAALLESLTADLVAATLTHLATVASERPPS